MNKQLDHTEFKQSQKHLKNESIFVLENLEHAENIGSAFRIADAFNYSKVVIISQSGFEVEKVKKTARSCEKHIPYEVYKSSQEALESLKEQGYCTVALEITSKSKPLRDVDFAKLGKVALIVGNEKYGVSDYMLENVKGTVHIDMYGNNSSMNVATALSIAEYKICEDCYNQNKKEYDNGRTSNF